MPFRLNKVYPRICIIIGEVNHYSVFQYPPYDLALASKIAEVVKREKLDILHAHYAMPHAVCAILAKQMSDRDVKVVTTLHGTDISILGNDPSYNGANQIRNRKIRLCDGGIERTCRTIASVIKPDKEISHRI